MPRCVELNDPGPDADELEVVLRAAGFRVSRVSLSALGTEGDASVVAGEQPGATEAVADLRRRRHSYPVVCLGEPLGVGELPTLPRPVRHDELLVALRDALSLDHRVPTHAGITRTAEVGPSEAPALELGPPEETPVSSSEQLEVAVPSAMLAELLSEICGPATLQSLAVGKEVSAASLAPDVLFEPPLGVTDALDEEGELTALEQALPAVESQRPKEADAAVAEPALESPVVDARHGWLRLEDPVLGELELGGSGRTATVGPLGMLRLLWRLVELGLDVDLDARMGATRRVLRLVAGGVREMWGESHLRACRVLGHAEGIAGEDEARQRLQQVCDEGRLARYTVDRQVRLADEAQLVELGLAETASFVIRPLSPADYERLAVVASPLAKSPLAVIAAGARARLDVARLERLAPESGVLQLTAEARSRLEQAEVEPEIAALVQRYDRRPYAGALDEAGRDAGVAGLLCLLAALDAARFVSASALPPAP